MERDRHFRALENMYLAAPINEFFRPRIVVSEASATIEIEASEKLFHSAGGVHGSVYFKMLDDAAFFAVNSLEREVFVLTASFSMDLKRPVSAGSLRSVGRVVERGERKFTADAVLFDSEGTEIARGVGVFVRGKLSLGDALGYGAD